MKTVENRTMTNVANGTSGKTDRLLSDNDLAAVTGGNGHVYMRFGVQNVPSVSPSITQIKAG